MSQPPIGIDLGTTYSALAIINPAARPEIVPNADGDRTTASAVYFPEDGSVEIGQGAIEVAGAYPDRVVRWVKREMGDPDWRITAGDTSYSAVQISGMILKKLKQDAEQTIGPVHQAVITVPAYFDEVRRQATIEAGRLAGLDVLRIINEPTAAALAYAHAGGEPGRILIYDFGGGTFDVSIVDVRNEKDVTVLCSEGDHQLGGYDLDTTLAKSFAAKFAEAHGAEITAESDKGAWQDLVTAAEKGKRTLSKRDKATGNVMSGGQLLNVPVTREEFETMIEDHLIRTQMLVENALTEADLKPSDIQEVLLIGGSTRVPAVKAMLTKMFGKEPLNRVNVDEAVALGAAIQAGMIMSDSGMIAATPQVQQRLAGARLSDVAPHSFGTRALIEAHGVMKPRNDIIIKKNTPIPTNVTNTYYTMGANQDAIECWVTQGEDEDLDFVKVLRTGSLALPEGLPDSSPIEITYSYDQNGTMRCTFREPSSGSKTEIPIEVLQPQDRAVTKLDIDESEFEDLVID
jgi:molecular chaperone DnaK